MICPDKVSTEEWLEAHRVAHSVGLRSNVTIMFGTVERPVHVARHLVRTRDLQKETGGFTEFVPLPFVHMATPIYLQGIARKGPTFREVLLIHAVGRIAYRGWIDNIQASWVKVGVHGARQALMAGCNDLGGTLMDENISRAAGASHGQELDDSDFLGIVEPLGRSLEQRTTLYGRTQTVGRRLRPLEVSEPVIAAASACRSMSEHAGVARRGRDRQRARRRAVSRRRRLRRRARARQGFDVAGRRSAGRGAVRSDGSRHRDLGRIGREHDGGDRVVRWQLRRSSVASGTTNWVRCSCTTSARPGCVRRNAGERRSRDRSFVHHRHPRRRTHDEHVPRRRRRAHRSGGRRRLGDRGADRVPRGISLRPTPSQGRVPPSGADRARRRPPGGADAVRLLLRRAAPR